MSFDLILQCFESGEPEPADRQSVLKVLQKHCKDTPDDFGYYIVNFQDGSSLEFSAKGLQSSESFTGCSFHIRGVSRELITFVYEVAVAGNMVIFNAQGTDEPHNPIALLVKSWQSTDLPEGVAANPILCNSPSHLSELIGFSFEGWKDYRDSVIRNK